MTKLTLTRLANLLTIPTILFFLTILWIHFSNGSRLFIFPWLCLMIALILFSARVSKTTKLTGKFDLAFKLLISPSLLFALVATISPLTKQIENKNSITMAKKEGQTPQKEGENISTKPPPTGEKNNALAASEPPNKTNVTHEKNFFAENDLQEFNFNKIVKNLPDFYFDLESIVSTENPPKALLAPDDTPTSYLRACGRNYVDWARSCEASEIIGNFTISEINNDVVRVLGVKKELKKHFNKEYKIKLRNVGEYNFVEDDVINVIGMGGDYLEVVGKAGKDPEVKLVKPNGSPDEVRFWQLGRLIKKAKKLGLIGVSHKTAPEDGILGIAASQIKLAKLDRDDPTTGILIIKEDYSPLGEALTIKLGFKKGLILFKQAYIGDQDFLTAEWKDYASVRKARDDIASARFQAQRAKDAAEEASAKKFTDNSEERNRNRYEEIALRALASDRMPPIGAKACAESIAKARASPVSENAKWTLDNWRVAAGNCHIFAYGKDID